LEVEVMEVGLHT